MRRGEEGAIDSDRAVESEATTPRIETSPAAARIRRSESIINTTLQVIVVGVVTATIIVNVMLVYEVQSKLSVQPKDVLKALERESAVTREQVMERLAEIEKNHMKYVKEYRELKEKK